MQQVLQVQTHAATAHDDDKCENQSYDDWTGTSLIIVVRLHAFKTAAHFLSALAENFQLHRKL
jgi:hypothetical protein